jgi:hypothetical protein
MLDRRPRPSRDDPSVAIGIVRSMAGQMTKALVGDLLDFRALRVAGFEWPHVARRWESRGDCCRASRWPSAQNIAPIPTSSIEASFTEAEGAEPFAAVDLARRRLS